jgi:hypothetical protein
MSGTVAAGRPAGEQASPAMAQPGAGRRGRRWLAAGVVLLAVAGGAVAAGEEGAFTQGGSPAAGGTGAGYHTSTAIVTLRSLSSQTLVAATLGDAGSYSVVNQAQGTITWLPPAGQLVHEGEVLYQVNGSPVVLLYGRVPAWRDLADGTTGPDVTELNTDLVQLGYAPAAALGQSSGWDYFSAETAYALQQLQHRLGVTETGTLSLGQAVFLPAAAQITGPAATTVLGGPAMPGATVLTATSTTPVVTIDLDTAQQTDVRAGEQVTITLPDAATTPGTIASVGTVASEPAGSGGSASQGSSPTVTVEVTLSDPQAAAGLSQAPVTVAITTGSVSHALVVPVDALLAQPGGGYAVEVTGPRGTRHLVAVSPGLFDDAAGLVQVTGTGLAAGQHVVVPAI